MRKLSLILAITTAVISAPTMAQNVTYACQYIESGGLDWKGQKWQSTRFHLRPPFFLKATSSKLDADSISKIIGEAFVICHEMQLAEIHSCSGFLGGSLIFDFKTLRGGVSQIAGATQSDDEDKDSLAVKPFTCTKM